MRRSAKVSSPSAASATTARMTIAAYTPAALKVPCDCATSRPMPLVAPMYSPTMAPMRAKPKLTWRLGKIQEGAEGMTTWRVTRRPCAPRIRALDTRLRSASRAPWKALKKTGKKTSTTAEATLEAGPSPNQITKIGARTILGIELSTLMYGPSTSASKVIRPSAMPKTTPATTPTTQPSSASYSVYQICSPNEPSAVPCVTHVQIWSQIFEGMEKLKGSMTSARE